MTWWETVMIGGLEQAGRAVVRWSDHPAREPRRDGPPDRGPVILVGGFGTTAALLEPMARGLGGRGHVVTPMAHGGGVGCAREAVDALVEEIETVYARTGRPVALVGHSRGGQFARGAALRVPHRVAALVTIGSPIALNGIDPVLPGSMWGMALVGTLGVPGVATLGCLFGSCCREFRDALRAPWPAEVPFVSISSPGDRVVPQRACHDPAAEAVEVDGGHLELLMSPRVLREVDDALVRADGAARTRTTA